MKTDLSNFSCSDFDRGSSKIKEVFWLIVRNTLFLYVPVGFYPLKRFVLRCFGANIGKGVVIKSGVKITFPWKLEVGDYVWLGEDSWILNLDKVVIKENVCISQRAMLFTGSHNYNKHTFDLITKQIIIEEGAWIATNSFVGPGVTVGSHAVLTAGSVANKDLEPFSIYQGNPAQKARERKITD